MSALVPGTGHLYAGRRRSGLAILAVFVGLVATIVAVVVWGRDSVLRAAVDPVALTGVMVAAGAVALGMVAVVLAAYRLGRPARSGGRWTVVSPGLAGVIALVVAAPPALAAHYAVVERGLISDVFPAGDDGWALTDPWPGQGRLNVLLIGGDGGPTGAGMHADSISVASVDPVSGDTMVFSLPRSLRNARFLPGTPAAADMPEGFPDFVYEVHEFGAEHPWLFPDAPDPGVAAVVSVTSQALGLPIHYYAVGDLEGFSRVVDAIGGLRIELTDPVPVGDTSADGAPAPVLGYVEPGPQVLDGDEAAWYARPSAGANDYARTMRHRCLAGAVARQADPVTLLRNFEALARATKDAMSTNIPQERLPEFVDLARKVSGAEITGVLFVPPKFSASDPDYDAMRAMVQTALATGSVPSSPPGGDGGAGSAGEAPPNPQSTTPPSASSASGTPAALAESCTYW